MRRTRPTFSFRVRRALIRGANFLMQVLHMRPTSPKFSCCAQRALVSGANAVIFLSKRYTCGLRAPISYATKGSVFFLLVGDAPKGLSKSFVILGVSLQIILIKLRIQKKLHVRKMLESGGYLSLIHF